MRIWIFGSTTKVGRTNSFHVHWQNFIWLDARLEDNKNIHYKWYCPSVAFYENICQAYGDDQENGKICLFFFVF